VPELLSNTTLTQLGIKDTLIRLVWRSLVFLGLITDEGITTPKFRALRYATDDQYGQVLSDIICDAYTDVIAVAPPESANRQQLMNAFRPYSPASQHPRMIGLFLALCAEAGMEVAQPAKRSAPRKASDGRPARSVARRSKGADEKKGHVADQTPLEGKEVVRDPATSSDEFTVQLRAGGSVTLKVNVGHFALSRNKADRTFVQGLMDALTEYEGQPVADVADVTPPAAEVVVPPVATEDYGDIDPDDIPF